VLFAALTRILAPPKMGVIEPTGVKDVSVKIPTSAGSSRRRRLGERRATLAKSDQGNRFDFASIAPQVVRAGGTVTEATGDDFPALVGNEAASFLLVLAPGAVREPHWHPNAWELDVPLSGRGQGWALAKATSRAGRPSSSRRASSRSRRARPSK
jgi:hypothetical protein